MINEYVDWFMNKLSKYERDKIRDKYSLNIRTLKITDEIIKDVYTKEIILKEKRYKLCTLCDTTIIF